MINLVRQSSDTPNIINKDDVRMIRYAYGGYNGVVKDFGSELAFSYDNALKKFKIGSGRVVLHGWEVDIDEAGFEDNFASYLAQSSVYYTVYLEVNAFVETAEIKSRYSVSQKYPTVDPGDDLTSTPNGIARLELYNFEISEGSIIAFEPRVQKIAYLKGVLESLLESDGETVKNGKWEPILEDGKIMQNSELAKELLPTTTGFFFGGTDYDEYYMEELPFDID